MAMTLSKRSSGFVGAPSTSGRGRKRSSGRAIDDGAAAMGGKARRSRLPGNPFTDRSRLWNERFGFQLEESAKWRKISMCMGGLSLVFSIVFVLTLVAPRISPFVLDVDRQGEIAVRGLAESLPGDDSRVTRGMILRFAMNARRFAVEGTDELGYSSAFRPLVEADSQAGSFVAALMRSARAPEGATVPLMSFRGVSVSPVGEGKWQVEWEERIPQPDRPAVSRRWKSVATVSYREPRDGEAGSANPLGFYVDTFEWGPVAPPESNPSSPNRSK